MAFTIDDKISILRIYQPSLTDLDLLIGLEPSKKIIQECIDHNPTPLLEWLEKIIYNTNLSEIKRLEATYLLNIFEHNVKVLELNTSSDDYPVFEDEEDYDDGEYKIFQENKAIIESWSQKDFNNKLFDFSKTEFPEIFEIGLKGKKSELRNAFNTSINLFHFGYQLKQKTIDKINKAFELLDKEADKSHRETELQRIDQWLEQYQEWLANLGLYRHTKSNLKEFFKAIHLKVLPTTIEIMHNKLKTK